MSDDANSTTANTQNSGASFADALQVLLGKQDELKEIKSFIKDLETDVPMELEELMLSLKDLKKQVKERKDEFLNSLLENSAEYGEYREKVQLLKEEIAQAKLDIFTEAANLARQHGDIDRTVMVQGVPQRLQTQREVSVFVNGKVIK